MPAAIRATDNFNRADSPDLGANWDVATGEDNAEIFSNTARASTLALTAGEFYNAVTFLPNQFSEITIFALVNVGTVVLAAIVRQQAGAQSHYTSESGVPGADASNIRKVIAGVETTLATNSTSLTAGDINRLTVINTNLAQYKNGVLNLTASDTTFSDGRPGILIFSDTDLSNGRIDSWLGGDFPPDFSDLFPKQKMRNAIARGFGYA